MIESSEGCHLTLAPRNPSVGLAVENQSKQTVISCTEVVAGAKKSSWMIIGMCTILISLHAYNSTMFIDQIPYVPILLKVHSLVMLMSFNNLESICAVVEYGVNR